MSRPRSLNIVAACVSLALVGLIAGCGGKGDSLGDGGDVAITVDTVKITNAEVERQARFLATAADSTGKVNPPAPDSDEYWKLRKQAAEGLRDQAVYGILAKKCGKPCAVTDKDVNDEVALILQQQFGGSQPNFDKTLKDRGITMADLKGTLKAGLQQQKLISQQEKGVTYTDAQAQAYYDKNLKTEFTTPAAKHLFHILLKSKAEATALRPQLTVDNFSTLAKERSLDAEAKKTGGDLGAVTSAGLIPEIAAAASTMKPGAFSQPIETQFGWHLLMVKTIPAVVKSFADAKDEIIATQLQAAKDAKVQKWRDTTVKKLQDTTKYANTALTPDPPATTTTELTSTTGAGTSTTK